MREELLVKLDKLPETLREMKKLCDHHNPYNIAMMFMSSFCVYSNNPDEAIKMLKYLYGPRRLTDEDISFVKDRLNKSSKYTPLSYFKGATPENEYQVEFPYELNILDDKDEDDYLTLFLKSGGADAPRLLKLRKKKDGTWWLWQHYLLMDIKDPIVDSWA